MSTILTHRATIEGKGLVLVRESLVKVEQWRLQTRTDCSPDKLLLCSLRTILNYCESLPLYLQTIGFVGKCEYIQHSLQVAQSIFTRTNQMEAIVAHLRQSDKVWVWAARRWGGGKTFGPVWASHYLVLHRHYIVVHRHYPALYTWYFNLSLSSLLTMMWPFFHTWWQISPDNRFLCDGVYAHCLNYCSGKGSGK